MIRKFNPYDNETLKLQFSNISDTAYAMIIYDGLEIPLESMKEILILNGKEQNLIS